MFEYVFVLVSIIVGLAVTHLLQGAVRVTRQTHGKPLYWVHLLWIANLLLNLVVWWWFEFQLREVRVWTFQLYLFVLAYAVLLYVICRLLVPEDIDGYESWKSWFLERRTGFFVGLTLVGPVDLADTLVKGQQHLVDLGWGYLGPSVLLNATSVIAIFVRDPRYHAYVAIQYMALLLWICFGLFGTMT